MDIRNLLFTNNTMAVVVVIVCEFEPCSWQGVLDTPLCNKVCQQLATDQWFSPCTPVSTTYKTDYIDITWILLKVALNTINLNQPTNNKRPSHKYSWIICIQWKFSVGRAMRNAIYTQVTNGYLKPTAYK